MDIFDDLGAARQAYIDAKVRSDAARRDETVALNQLNEAQKTVDVHMEELRKEHPPASHWASRHCRGGAV